MIPVRLRLSAIDLDVLNPSKFPPVQWLRCSRFFGARRPERARRAPLPPNEKGPTRGLFHWRTGWDCGKQPLGCFPSLAALEIARLRLAPKIACRRFCRTWVCPPHPISQQKRPRKGAFLLADRVGFEPTVRLHVRRISSAVPSTTRPPVRRR